MPGDLPAKLTVACLLLFGREQTLLAQVKAAAASPSLQGPSVLHSTTRLVQINVVAQNKKGAPVQDLRKEHFTVLDQGIPQQIAIFSAHSMATPLAPPGPPLGPNIFTNRLDQNGQSPGSVTVILFDALNTPIMDQSRAREQVLKFLRQLRPQDHVALYILTTKIITVSEFTQDASSLLKAVSKFAGYSSVQLDASTPETRDNIAAQATALDVERMSSLLRDFIRGGEDQISDFANVDRAMTTTSAMEAIANHVARIPGRKNLIWVSGSFPISIGYDPETIMQLNREHRSFGPELEHASRAMDQANMAVYPVDARGLMVSSVYSASNGTGFNGRTPPRPGDLAPNPDNFFTMTTLADRTGGRASYNTNDIEGAIQRAIGDSEYTYTIGFYPSHGKWDGKFHELKVRVEDKSVNLRYRKGYFATPEPTDHAAENQENLDAAMRSSVEWTNLDIQVTLRTIDTASHALTLQVAFDTHELQFAQKEGRQIGKMYVFFQQLGEGSKQVASEKETFDMNFKPETYEKLLQIGTKFSGQIVLAPDAIDLRVIGQDATSGAIGTVKIPIKQFLAARMATAGQAGIQESAKPN